MNAGYASVSRKDQRLERRGAEREPGCRPRGGDGGPATRRAALASVADRHLRDLVRDHPDRASLEGTGVAEPRGPQGSLIPGKEATNDHATGQHQHHREGPYAFREPAGRTAARSEP